jgi:arylsulfatase A-like enzyme
VDAPESFQKLYDGVTFHENPVKNESRLRMAAMVSQLDAKIGELVAALEKTGQRENTLILFSSDNGGIESLQNAYVGKVPHSPLNSENDPLRGQKNTLYEGGTRVCAWANWPGKLKPQKFTVPMHCVDWMPTLAELVGYQPAADLKWDGVSQWQGLTGITRNADAEMRTIYIAKKDERSLRQGEWKIIVQKKGKAELYRIGNDPYEKEDLAASEPGKLADLQKLLDLEHAKDNPNMPKDLEGFPH